MFSSHFYLYKRSVYIYVNFLLFYLCLAYAALFFRFILQQHLLTHTNVSIYSYLFTTQILNPIFYKLHQIKNSQANRQNFILFRKLTYKHENSEQFPCLYRIPRISTTFSVKLIHLSANINNILLLFTFPLDTITETPNFCVKVYFCLIVRFFPQSPPFQRRQK